MKRILFMIFLMFITPAYAEFYPQIGDSNLFMQFPDNCIYSENKELIYCFRKGESSIIFLPPSTFDLTGPFKNKSISEISDKENLFNQYNNLVKKKFKELFPDSTLEKVQYEPKISDEKMGFDHVLGKLVPYLTKEKVKNNVVFFSWIDKENSQLILVPVSLSEENMKNDWDLMVSITDTAVLLSNKEMIELKKLNSSHKKSN